VLAPPEECTVGPSKIPDEPIGTKHVTFESLVSDPQGYRFRLIQRAEGARRVAKLVYRVTDLEKSQAFYSELLGMSVLRWRSNLQSTPLDISLTMQVGDPAVLNGAAVLEAEGNVPGQPVIELVYSYNTRKLDVGSAGAGRLTLAAAGASELATRAPSANGKLVDAAAEGGALVQDPDGFELRLVAN
jgi:catechol 2,3-dioxygenase-like lactoylglutathione lyase family enzyme